MFPCVDRTCTLSLASYCPIFAEWQQLKGKNKFTWSKQETKSLSNNLERKLIRMNKMGVAGWSRWPEVPSNLNYIFLLWKHKNLQTQNAQELNLFSVQEGISLMHLWATRNQFDNRAPYILSAEYPYLLASPAAFVQLPSTCEKFSGCSSGYLKISETLPSLKPIPLSI